MRRKVIFGIVLVMLLFLQVQSIFANDRQTTRLIQAVNRGNVSNARAALDRSANVNARFSNTTETVLYGAVENRNLEMVRLLLERGANPNLRGRDPFDNTPLARAIRNRDIEIVRLLLEHGANVNDRDSPRSPRSHGSHYTHSLRLLVLLRKPLSATVNRLTPRTLDAIAIFWLYIIFIVIY